MKKFLIIFFLLAYGICNGQNLVFNPSFELYNSCPDFFSQISRATGWYSARPTADYFHTCAPFFPRPYTCVNVPENTFGYRTPESGSAYAGVLGSVGNSEHREAIGGQLLHSLQIGTKYYVSFKVSAGANVNVNQWCGINKIGALFYTSKYDSAALSPICSNCAQISSDSIVTDTLNWTMIKGSFVADSNYSFISLGRFNLNALTSSVQLAGTSCNAYYYFDDICVSEDSAYAYSYVYTGEVVPTKLLNFSCTSSGTACIINWASAEEINLEKYIVEYSENGTYFKPAATIAAEGPNSKYNYIHEQAGISAFYRLKLLARDGSVTYSEARFVKFDRNNSFTIVPNPAQEAIYVFNKNNAAIKSVQLLSMDGKIIKIVGQYNSGQAISISGLAKGAYILKIVNRDNTTGYRMFVKL